MLRSFLLSAALLAWILLIGAGFAVAVAYTGAPGPAGPTPEQWPLSADLPDDRMSLLVFAHPRCPCTVATIHELARLQRYIGEETDIAVHFFAPVGEEKAWQGGSLWRQAAAIPGVSVRTDPDGRLAERFGALTSGHAVLYAPDGTLRFSGGITPGRGHEGDSTGAQAIRAAVLRGQTVPVLARIFGCGLASTVAR